MARAKTFIFFFVMLLKFIDTQDVDDPIIILQTIIDNQHEIFSKFSEIFAKFSGKSVFANVINVINTKCSLWTIEKAL